MTTIESNEGFSQKLCDICQVEKEEHLQLEQRGLRKHQFSEDGQVRAVEKKRETRAPRPVIQIMPVPDLALRALLRSKGLLTDEEMETLDKAKLVIQTEAPRDQHDES